MGPDVVVSSEREICAAYSRLQRWPLRKFAIVFNNGGNHRPPFPRVDIVKHSSPVPMQWAVDAGEDPLAHVAIEEGVNLPRVDLAHREEARTLLDLPADAFVVLSVGLLDLDRFKRVAFVANEAADSGLDPFLVLLGQRDTRRPPRSWRRLCIGALPGGNCIASVAPDHQSLPLPRRRCSSCRRACEKVSAACSPRPSCTDCP